MIGTRTRKQGSKETAPGIGGTRGIGARGIGEAQGTEDTRGIGKARAKAVPRHAAGRLRAVTALLACVLSACSTAPEYLPPSVELPAAFRHATAEDGWQPARPAQAGTEAWWTVFDDRRLDLLMAALDDGNQDLRVAEANYRQALAAVDGARAGLYPQVSAGAAASRSRVASRSTGLAERTGSAGTRNDYIVDLQASWELDLWGRVRAGSAVAEASAAASAADLAAIRLSLQAQLAQSYFELRVADAQRRVLADTVLSYRRSLKLTRDRLAVGVAARGDVAQAEAQLKNAEAQALELELARAQLEHAIAVLTGHAPAKLAVPQADLDQLVPTIPAGLPSALLERRPDVAAAERRVAAANAQIGVARAAYFPSLVLSADGGLRADRLGDLLSLPNRFWSLGPALAMALFDGGARLAASEQALAAYDATVAAYRRTVLSALLEVEDSLVAHALLAEQERVQREALAAARTSLEIVTNQYKAGTVSFLNVIQVQTTALQAERAVLELRGRRLAAAIALIRAIGGGWQAPLRESR